MKGLVMVSMGLAHLEGICKRNLLEVVMGKSTSAYQSFLEFSSPRHCGKPLGGVPGRVVDYWQKFNKNKISMKINLTYFHCSISAADSMVKKEIGLFIILHMEFLF
jgi:hypothetical protein